MLGHVVQSVAYLTHEPEVPGWTPGPAHTFVSPSADSRRAVVSYWQKYMYMYLHQPRITGYRLRKRVVMLTDCPDLTIDAYHGHKTTR